MLAHLRRAGAQQLCARQAAALGSCTPLPPPPLPPPPLPPPFRACRGFACAAAPAVAGAQDGVLVRVPPQHHAASLPAFVLCASARTRTATLLSHTAADGWPSCRAQLRDFLFDRLYHPTEGYFTRSHGAVGTLPAPLPFPHIMGARPRGRLCAASLRLPRSRAPTPALRVLCTHAHARGRGGRASAARALTAPLRPHVRCVTPSRRPG